MSDELFRDIDFAHRLSLPVLGVTCDFEANDERLIDRVREHFGAWCALDDRPDLIEARPLRISLTLQAGDEGGARRPSIAYRVPERERLLVHTSGSFGVADTIRGSVVAYVTAAFVEDRAQFREAFLASLTYYLVTASNRQPFHAAAVAQGTTALLLYGPSGVGKSTLSWACALRGLRIMSDDVVFFQTRPTPRVWGAFDPILVPVASAHFFDALPPDCPVIEVGGREKLEARPERAGQQGELPFAERAGIALLAPSVGAPRLEPVDADEVLRVAARPMEPGFDIYADSIGTEVERVSRNGAWRLHMGDDPHAAAALVEQAMATLARSLPNVAEQA